MGYYFLKSPILSYSSDCNRANVRTEYYWIIFFMRRTRCFATRSCDFPAIPKWYCSWDREILRSLPLYRHRYTWIFGRRWSRGQLLGGQVRVRGFPCIPPHTIKAVGCVGSTCIRISIIHAFVIRGQAQWIAKRVIRYSRSSNVFVWFEYPRDVFYFILLLIRSI